MPRKAKEKEIVIEEKNVVEKDVKSTAKATTKKVAEKKSTAAKSTKKASTASTKKTTTKSTTKKASTASTKKTTTKSTTKRASTASTKKTTKPKSKKTANLEVLEYYDLPYKYGNTLVKLLAQTPKTLFIYWEISDLDIQNYKKQFGDNFFNVTKPILIVHNITLNKTYEVEINDFANCWYLTTEDADCKFDIELARKFIGAKSNNEKSNEEEFVSKADNDDLYLHIAKSNNLKSPNDHILFEKLSESITFKNVKTGKSKKEEIKNFKFLNDLYKFYKDMYKDEFLKNPSSKINM